MVKMSNSPRLPSKSPFGCWQFAYCNIPPFPRPAPATSSSGYFPFFAAAAAEIVALAGRKCCQRNRNVPGLPAPVNGVDRGQRGGRQKAGSPQGLGLVPGQDDYNDFVHLSLRLAQRMALAFMTVNCILRPGKVVCLS